MLLFYAADEHPTWNQVYQPYREEYIQSHYRHIEEGTGRRYQLDNCLNPNPDRPNLTYEWNGIVRVWRWTKQRMQELHEQGRIVHTKSGMPRYKRYLDEMPGTPVTDVWTDIPPINSQARERLGYPTQEPEALLERIIKASSNEGDVVLDPFCGCGTTVVVAERLHRRWIGIDLTHLAITLMKNRLQDTFGPELSPYKVIGEPQDVSSALALAQQNRHQFQFWALGLVDARPAGEQKKGADRGIDGEIRFFDDDSGKAKRLLIQVKSGQVHSSVIRDLKGVLEREKAEVGALLTLEEPTGPMKTEAAEAGFYDPPSLLPPVPRLQVLTIEDLLSGRTLDYPSVSPATFKRAARQRKTKRKGHH